MVICFSFINSIKERRNDNGFNLRKCFLVFVGVDRNVEN